MIFQAVPADGCTENIRLPLKSGETFIMGAFVLLDSNEEVDECAADPTANVYGIALHDAVNDLSPAHCTIAKAVAGRKFWMAGDNNPTINDRNQEYGVAKDADGVWYVDGTDTSNKVVYVHDVDLDRNLYLVEVIDTVRQINKGA